MAFGNGASTALKAHQEMLSPVAQFGNLVAGPSHLLSLELGSSTKNGLGPGS